MCSTSTCIFMFISNNYHIILYYNIPYHHIISYNNIILQWIYHNISCDLTLYHVIILNISYAISFQFCIVLQYSIEYNVISYYKTPYQTIVYLNTLYYIDLWYTISYYSHINVHPTYMHFAPHKSFKQGQPGSFLQGFDLPETNLRETVGPRARHGYMVRMVKLELNSWNSRQFTRIQTTQLWSLTAGTSQAPNDLLPSSLAAMACGRSSQHPSYGIVNRTKTHHKRKKRLVTSDFLNKSGLKFVERFHLPFNAKSPAIPQ